MSEFIPAAKPLLPRAEQILPYLRQLDENRYYTNFGPLVNTLTRRLENWVGAQEGGICTCSNGTTALELAIAAMEIPAGKTAMLQAFTFSATAHAAYNQGLNLLFTDIDRKDWALTPSIARKAISTRDDIALVIATAPFGHPMPVKEWEAFSKEFNVPVLIDAAGINPQDVQPSAIVTSTISLHTTKILPAGEGGLIVRNDPDYIDKVKNISNFGLFDPRGISVKAQNAKMSEYHAAIAMASMDEWDDIWNDFMRVAKRYKENLHGQNAVRLRPGYGDNLCNALCIIETPDPVIHEDLHALGFGSRAVWRTGCHLEPLFEKMPKTGLENTYYIAPRNAGIPCYRDLQNDQIDMICEKLLAYIQGNKNAA